MRKMTRYRGGGRILAGILSASMFLTAMTGVSYAAETESAEQVQSADVLIDMSKAVKQLIKTGGEGFDKDRIHMDEEAASAVGSDAVVLKGSARGTSYVVTAQMAKVDQEAYAKKDIGEILDGIMGMSVVITNNTKKDIDLTFDVNTAELCRYEQDDDLVVVRDPGETVSEEIEETKEKAVQSAAENQEDITAGTGAENIQAVFETQNEESEAGDIGEDASQEESSGEETAESGIFDSEDSLEGAVDEENQAPADEAEEDESLKETQPEIKEDSETTVLESGEEAEEDQSVSDIASSSEAEPPEAEAVATPSEADRADTLPTPSEASPSEASPSEADFKNAAENMLGQGMLHITSKSIVSFGLRVQPPPQQLNRYYGYQRGKSLMDFYVWDDSEQIAYCYNMDIKAPTGYKGVPDGSFNSDYPQYFRFDDYMNPASVDDSFKEALETLFKESFEDMCRRIYHDEPNNVSEEVAAEKMAAALYAAYPFDGLGLMNKYKFETEQEKAFLRVITQGMVYYLTTGQKRYADMAQYYDSLEGGNRYTGYANDIIEAISKENFGEVTLYLKGDTEFKPENKEYWTGYFSVQCSLEGTVAFEGLPANIDIIDKSGNVISSDDIPIGKEIRLRSHSEAEPDENTVLHAVYTHLIPRVYFYMHIPGTGKQYGEVRPFQNLIRVYLTPEREETAVTFTVADSNIQVTPDPEPTPKPNPAPNPAPVPGGSSDDGGSEVTTSSGTTETQVTIPESQVPLANLPPDQPLYLIDDPDVPLAALPKTGDRGSKAARVFIWSLLLGAFILPVRKKNEKPTK